MFAAATERMSDRDPRRRISIEHSSVAERKSNYYQSQEVSRTNSESLGERSSECAMSPPLSVFLRNAFRQKALAAQHE